MFPAGSVCVAFSTTAPFVSVTSVLQVSASLTVVVPMTVVLSVPSTFSVAPSSPVPETVNVEVTRVAPAPGTSIDGASGAVTSTSTVTVSDGSDVSPPRNDVAVRSIPAPSVVLHQMTSYPQSLQL